MAVQTGSFQETKDLANSNSKCLADVVAKAMTKLMTDGDYTKILDQWGVGNTAIKTAEANPNVEKQRKQPGSPEPVEQPGFGLLLCFGRLLLVHKKHHQQRHRDDCRSNDKRNQLGSAGQGHNTEHHGDKAKRQGCCLDNHLKHLFSYWGWALALRMQQRREPLPEEGCRRCHAT